MNGRLARSCLELLLLNRTCAALHQSTSLGFRLVASIETAAYHLMTIYKLLAGMPCPRLLQTVQRCGGIHSDQSVSPAPLLTRSAGPYFTKKCSDRSSRFPQAVATLRNVLADGHGGTAGSKSETAANEPPVTWESAKPISEALLTQEASSDEVTQEMQPAKWSSKTFLPI